VCVFHASNPFQTSDGTTALHLAASIGAVSVIELLLLNGGKADVQDFEGRSPLHWATLQRGTKTFSVLLKVRGGGGGGEGGGLLDVIWQRYSIQLSHVLNQG
jgi:ankyrin repeat protein